MIIDDFSLYIPPLLSSSLSSLSLFKITTSSQLRRHFYSYHTIGDEKEPNPCVLSSLVNALCLFSSRLDFSHNSSFFGWRFLNFLASFVDLALITSLSLLFLYPFFLSLLSFNLPTASVFASTHEGIISCVVVLSYLAMWKLTLSFLFLLFCWCCFFFSSFHSYCSLTCIFIIPSSVLLLF